MARTKEQQATYDKIGGLVEHFASQIEVFKKSQNEDETRIQFINPLFDALGWDIDNTKRKAIDSDRDVVHEDRMTIEGKSKAPDYSFRIGGKRKFFVEAKKPSIKIETDIVPSYQLRRYGWNDPEVHISILTDFEEFALYDCTIQPKQIDAANFGRIDYITYNQYLEKFDWLWDLFSKEQVLKGSLDQFAKSVKKGTQSVDAAFLQSLDEWRKYLATSIALRNRHLNEDEINYFVQMNINRIVFIRNCEDRGAEPYGKLKTCLVNSKEEGGYFRNIYQVFEDADRKYNSGLFDFTKDTLSKSVIIDNEVISTIVDELYFPKSPYEFSVIGVEILGTAYERFLGKVIRLTPDHQAVVEEKPEVRKAGGVYYTPQYIVEYIVKQTVGKLIEGKNLDEIAKIKICDPACGSGSFLLGAYQFLLNYHTDWYNKNYKKSRNLKDSPLTPDGGLTTHAKKQILLNNIFGVDIDTQAVEVTKLSLLLKCMEGETNSTLQTTLTFERVLPTLDNNIKSGNSLVDFDFYDGQLDFGENKTVKPFNWKGEFPQVFKQGGFDVILGNPPYFSLDIVSNEQKDYLEKKYSYFATRQSNIYFFFMAKSKDILKNDGLLSFINERYYFNSKNAAKFRKYLLTSFKVEEILDFQNIQIFDGVNTLTVINTFKNAISQDDIRIIQYGQEIRKLNDYNLSDSILANRFVIKQEQLNEQDWTFNNSILLLIRDKFMSFPTLDKVVNMGQGLKSGLNEVFIVDEETIDKYKLETEILVKYVKTKDIQEYTINFRNLYLILSLNSTNIDLYPNIKTYLNGFRKELEARYQFNDGTCRWYSLSIPQNLNLMTDYSEKILTPLYSKGNKFALDIDYSKGGFYVLTDAFVLTKKIDLDLKYLSGILNSTLINFINSKFGKLKRDGYYEYSRNTLSKIPIKLIDHKNKIEKNYHDEIVTQVNKILSIYSESEISPDTWTELAKRLNYAKQRIDEIVYQLYDLTPNEIKIVEGQT